LKNKKGKKQQTYIKHVAHQVQGDQKKQNRGADEPKVSKRDAEKAKLEELNALFKPVQQAQKVAAGVDPKSVVCNFFKQNLCQKGSKCKFSHDLSLERKSEKRSIYEDAEPEDKETMADWDQNQLEEVVKKKHGASNANKPKTDIVCKYFVEALEKSCYGWFWNCPNGDSCIYKHVLPQGFILKKDKKNMDELAEEEKISLEELIETERANLTGDLTPVTLESFLLWKQKKIQEKKDKHEKEMTKKREDFNAGVNKASGKELFLFKPELADADDEDASADMDIYRRRDDDEQETGTVVEVSLEGLAASAKSSSDSSTATKALSLSAKDRDINAPTSSRSTSTANGPETTSSADVNGLDMATGSTEDNSKSQAEAAVVVDGVPVDESLFEDLDDLTLFDYYCVFKHSDFGLHSFQSKSAVKLDEDGNGGDAVYRNIAEVVSTYFVSKRLNADYVPIKEEYQEQSGVTDQSCIVIDDDGDDDKVKIKADDAMEDSLDLGTLGLLSQQMSQQEAEEDDMRSSYSGDEDGDKFSNQLSQMTFDGERLFETQYDITDQCRNLMESLARKWRDGKKQYVDNDWREVNGIKLDYHGMTRHKFPKRKKRKVKRSWT